MHEDPGTREARRRVAKAVEDLRRARRLLVEAKVPMEGADGGPPRWTVEQHAAVTRYMNGWRWLLVAHQSYWQNRDPDQSALYED